MIAWLKRLWRRRWWRKAEPTPPLPPANLLTIDMVTAKALEVLHRQHDAAFTNSDAKIGTTLRIRLPKIRPTE